MAKSLEEIIGGAQRLMLDEEWNRQVDMSERLQSGMKKKGKGNISDAELKSMEASVFGFSSAPSAPQQPRMQYQQPQTQSQYPPMGYQQPRVQKQPRIDLRHVPSQIQEERKQQTYEESLERLPEALRESFKKTPPLSGELFQAITAPETVNINEQQAIQTQQPQMTIPVGGGVDYGVIKAIVNECLKEYGKNLLTEGLAGLRIKDGNVISFVDKKGNLFEATLKLKKKANPSK